MKANEPLIYGAYLDLFNERMNSLSALVQGFLVYNTVAIPYVYSADQTEVAKVALCIMGVVTHISLGIAFRNGNKWLEFLGQKLVDLELLDADEEKRNNTSPRILMFADPDFLHMVKDIGVSPKVFEPVCLAFTGLWVGEGLRQMFLLSSGG